VVDVNIVIFVLCFGLIVLEGVDVWGD